MESLPKLEIKENTTIEFRLQGNTLAVYQPNGSIGLSLICWPNGQEELNVTAIVRDTFEASLLARVKSLMNLLAIMNDLRVEETEAKSENGRWMYRFVKNPTEMRKVRP